MVSEAPKTVKMYWGEWAQCREERCPNVEELERERWARNEAGKECLESRREARVVLCLTSEREFGEGGIGQQN